MKTQRVAVVALGAWVILGASMTAASQKHGPSAELEITPKAGTAEWQAVSRSQNLRATFDDRGMRVTPERHDTASWDWGIALLRYGRPGELHAVSGAPLAPSANRAERHRPGIVEWYVNHERGIEHGFTLPTSPRSDGKGPEIFIELSLTGSLAPSFSTDGQAIDFRTGDGAYALRYAELKVTDAAGRELPARMEAFMAPGVGGIRIRFDDDGATYPVTIDPLTSTAAWTAESNQANAYFGSSLQTAGDVNGDGYSDVIVGAASYTNGQFAEGAAFVYLGSASGLAASAAWNAEGDQSGSGFGSTVATAGDVNGDGYDDVIVGASGRDNGQTDEGQAFLYLGSASGLAASPAWTGEGNVAGAGFGCVVASAGDVNGDGYDDVLVGECGYNNGSATVGRARLYLGSALGPLANASWTAVGAQTDACFACALGSAGDVNADGYSDVVIGSPSYTNGQAEEGAAFVYLGSASGLATTPAWTGEGGQNFAQYGGAVATAGDVNGDGYSDVIVGAPAFSNGEPGEGLAFVYLGSATGPASAPVWTGEGNQGPTPGFNDGTNYGWSVATAGDVNGDGYADIMVGALKYDAFGQDDGRVFVYLGSASGPATAEVVHPFGGQLFAGFGVSVATAGDVNGDGFSDYLVGAHNFDNGQTNEGRAFLYAGAGASVSRTRDWVGEGGQQNARYGWSVGSAGDVNGDGYSDTLVGASVFSTVAGGEGRAYLYSGSATGPALAPAWTATGTQFGEYVGTCVATAGDVNGDGFSDVVIGAAGHSDGTNHSGHVDLYLGSPSGLSPSPAWTLGGTIPNMTVGTFVASAGDVNGDGFSDVIVTRGFGYVLYLGSSTGLATSAAWQFALGQAYFGGFYDLTAASAGDVNGDGFSDVVVGASGYSNGQIYEGRALLFLGSGAGLSPTPAWTFEGDQDNAGVGASVGSAGDVNGDGYSDVIIGAPDATTTIPEDGLAYVFVGSASGLATSPSWSIGGPQGNSNFGGAVASAGDVNADGYADIVVGARYRNMAFVYLGSSSGLPSTHTTFLNPQAAGAGFGKSAAPAGDVNGDGFSDLIVGGPDASNPEPYEGTAQLFFGNAWNGFDRRVRQYRIDGTGPIALLGKSSSLTSFRLAERGLSPSGRGKIRLEWEIKPLGTPFTGTGLGATPTQDTGAPAFGGSIASYSLIVSGLNPGTFYHWRTRLVIDNPFFPRSPWMSMTGNTMTETKLKLGGCVDGDGDGRGSPGDPLCAAAGVDCDDGNPLLWAAPGTTSNLLFTSKTTLQWIAPSSPGGAASELRYDTLRAPTAQTFTSCLESNDGPNTTASDAATPAPGAGFYYVNRARNACPGGVGSLGATSVGGERTGVTCP